MTPPTVLQVLTLRHHLRLGSKGAAAELGVAFQTVRNNLSTLYLKLGVSGDIEAALKLGWLRLPDSDEIAALGVLEMARNDLQQAVDRASTVLADLERVRSAGLVSGSPVAGTPATTRPGAPDSSECDFPARMGDVHRLDCEHLAAPRGPSPQILLAADNVDDDGMPLEWNTAGMEEAANRADLDRGPA